MDVLENLSEWESDVWEPFERHYERSGELDWKLYKGPRNSGIPGTGGVALHRSRLMLVSSAGAFLAGSQQPFDAANKLGDYTMRVLPSTVAFDDLDFAHGHYDDSVVRRDPEVALPLRLLEGLVPTGRIGSLALSLVSIMGYQPNAARVVRELLPQVRAVAEAEYVDAALLAPV